MESALPVTKRIHPLLATAAIAVTLVSFAGVAAMTGMLPSSHSKITPPAEQTALAPEVKPVSESPVPAPVVKLALHVGAQEPLPLPVGKVGKLERQIRKYKTKIERKPTRNYSF